MAATGPSAPGRDVWARRALADVAKMLTLQDRTPHSPTYGCFDRNHWHYKIIDFPSGMAQEFVWPLALAATSDLPDNPFRRSAALRDWVEAGLDFARRASHLDGSCDDYFPYERATGAAAFSLLAGLESYRLMELERPDLLAFFERRTGWLARHRESGQLSNHEALVVACLIRLSDLTGTDRWNGAIRDRLDRLLSWQTREGWFREYEGCDPGYLTLTIGLLAMIDRWRPGYALREPLDRAVRFAAELMHPDGSYGGEYTSRNTHNYFPHGFEMVGDRLPEALAMNDRHRAALEAGRGPCYADDHILGHHAWSYLLAWREHRPERPAPRAEPDGRHWFPEAGLLVERRGGRALFAGLNKGGAFTLFRDGAPVLSDTQISLRVAHGGRARTAVAHLVDRYPVALDDDTVTVSGGFGWAKHTQMTVFRMVLLRVVMTTAGRFFPNLIRRMLQTMLIAGRRPAPFRFCRSFRWEGAELVVEDRVEGDGWRSVESAGLGGHQTSIYVVMSRVFTPAQLQPWCDLTPLVKDLDDGQPLTLVRRF
ncbi:hypothetical protein [Azospirillum brasilense]|uniref:Heparinase II/III-like protein n=1 Tax=Azospirillum brasilense TaxID=192 RepID=A0A235HAZ2_AZOBR|nr:hypothetical protein [Azospirillum brasilense]OYD82908.1 hypothetical protein CHT98_18650 [Azospirillum brasilense]